VNEKPCRVLVSVKNIEDPYIKQVADDIETNQSHVSNIVKFFREEGYISFTISGSKRLLSLTEEGENLADSVESLYDTFEDLGENPQ